MKQIVECVPNFSEGRNPAIIKRITDEIEKVDGVILLDVDPGRDTNRTVVTFAGPPEEAKEAAFQAIKKASELIDMSRHSGAHARMGATDVCPFVPVSGVTMDDCVRIAGELGERVADELQIPVYLYEEAATDEKRRSLAHIREGEYEALPQKLKKPEFKPDFGPAVFNSRSGATVIGAREFLIAYNVNLNTREVKIARKIASRVREKGRRAKNKETGAWEQLPGSLKAVRGVGWYIDEYKMAQLSFNLLNYKTTPLHRLFEEAERFAVQFGVRVTGSELVGLIPLEAVRQSGRHFLQKQGVSTGVSEEELIRVAVQSLGLNEISEFAPEHKIIEYRFRSGGKLAAMNLMEFANELASDSPAPGGGSIAALNGAMSAGLSAMVGNLTYSKKAYKKVRQRMIGIAEEAQKLKDFFIDAIDRDTDAFNKIMDAFSLPKKSEKEMKLRQQQIETATKEATQIPLTVLQQSEKAAELALEVAETGNVNSLSDAGVAGLAALASAEGALYNVMINLGGIEDGGYVEEVSAEARACNGRIQELVARLQAHLRRELKISK